jgi:hypothetical protein
MWRQELSISAGKSRKTACRTGRKSSRHTCLSFASHDFVRPLSDRRRFRCSTASYACVRALAAQPISQGTHGQDEDRTCVVSGTCVPMTGSSGPFATFPIWFIWAGTGPKYFAWKLFGQGLGQKSCKMGTSLTSRAISSHVGGHSTRPGKF